MIDDAAITTATRTAEAGAGLGLVGWLMQINWIGLAGVVIAAVGLAANLYYQRRRDRRERTEHESRMAAIRDRCEE